MSLVLFSTLVFLAHICAEEEGVFTVEANVQLEKLLEWSVSPSGEVLCSDTLFFFYDCSFFLLAYRIYVQAI
jgi:hypothetical protein